MTPHPYEPGGRFPTTHWSLVAQVGRRDADDQREALGRLLIAYLPALKAHLVHGKQLATEDAEDLIQEFIATKVLEKDLIARADRELGKFRTFLLTALDRFLINYVRDQHAKKRRPGDGRLQALGDRAEMLEAETGPSDAFDTAWARGLVAEALRRMRRECEESDRPDVWGVFQCRVMDPILTDAEAVDYRELVRRFGFQSPSQASNVLMTAKRMYARVLRSVVAEYAPDGLEIESEIRELRQILSRAG